MRDYILVQGRFGHQPVREELDGLAQIDPTGGRF